MKLIIISGIAGTGKSTLAAYLAGKLGYDVISKDVIKEKEFASGVRSLSFRNWWWFERRSWRLFFGEIQAAIEQDKSVIVEGNYYGRYSKVAAKQAAKLGTHGVREVFCTARPGIIYERYVRRLKADRHPAHFDNIWRYNFAAELFFVKHGFLLHNRHILSEEKALVVDTSMPKTINYPEILKFVSR